MKKVFFTAIAMIAFSGVSMANTIADEEVVTENSKIEVKKILLQEDTKCRAAKFKCYVDARAAGFSVQDATSMSYSIYFTCMGLLALEEN